MLKTIKKWKMSDREKRVCARIVKGCCLSQDGTNKGSQETSGAEVDGIAESSAAATGGSGGWGAGGRGPSRRGGRRRKGPRGGDGGGRSCG